MELSAIKTLLELTDTPTLALRDGVVLLANSEAAALGLTQGSSLFERLPELSPPLTEAAFTESTALLDGRRWTFRFGRAQDTTLCFLKPCSEFFPAPNESTLLYTAGNIRTTLQDLLVSLNALADTVYAVPEAERQTALALRSVYRLRRMAGNLELLASLSAGSFQLCRQDSHPVAAVRALCAELDELLLPIGHTLKRELPRGDLSRFLDWPLISALLRELLLNAAADASDGQISLRMTVLEKKRLCFAVRNTPRVPLPEAPFHRHAAAQTDLTGGAGLGLSLVSAGAACHGGGLMLSTDEHGAVTALLTIETAEQADELVRSPLQLPREPDANLVALSPILPDDFFCPEDLL